PFQNTLRPLPLCPEYCLAHCPDHSRQWKYFLDPVPFQQGPTLGGNRKQRGQTVRYNVLPAPHYWRISFYIMVSRAAYLLPDHRLCGERESLHYIADGSDTVTPDYPVL